MTALQETRARRKAERAAHRLRHNQYITEAQRIVEKGVCPRCGTALRRNNAITGWWQCGRFGHDSFRAVEYRGQPECNFQCFTD